jgi:hypothetical protein
VGLTERLERLEQAAAARQAPASIAMLGYTDPSAPWFARAAALDLVYWDQEAGNWRPVNPRELRALLCERRTGCGR